MEDDPNSSHQSPSSSVDDRVSGMSSSSPPPSSTSSHHHHHSGSSSGSLSCVDDLRSALAINSNPTAKIGVAVGEETPAAPCSSPSSQAEDWTQAQQVTKNSILNKRKLFDKLCILALASEQSSCFKEDDDSSDEEEEDEDDGEGIVPSNCHHRLLQTDRTGKSNVSSVSSRASNRLKPENPPAAKKHR